MMSACANTKTEYLNNVKKMLEHVETWKVCDSYITHVGESYFSEDSVRTENYNSRS